MIFLRHIYFLDILYAIVGYTGMKCNEGISSRRGIYIYILEIMVVNCVQMPTCLNFVTNLGKLFKFNTVKCYV